MRKLDNILEQRRQEQKALLTFLGWGFVASLGLHVVALQLPVLSVWRTSQPALDRASEPILDDEIEIVMAEETPLEALLPTEHEPAPQPEIAQERFLPADPPAPTMPQRPERPSVLAASVPPRPSAPRFIPQRLPDPQIPIHADPLPPEPAISPSSASQTPSPILPEPSVPQAPSTPLAQQPFPTPQNSPAQLQGYSPERQSPLVSPESKQTFPAVSANPEPVIPMTGSTEETTIVNDRVASPAPGPDASASTRPTFGPATAFPSSESGGMPNHSLAGTLGNVISGVTVRHSTKMEMGDRTMGSPNGSPTGSPTQPSGTSRSGRPGEASSRPSPVHNPAPSTASRGSFLTPQPVVNSSKPRCIHCPLPQYRGFEGSPRVVYDITPAGRVVNVRLWESSGDPQSDQVVLETLQRWRFDPKTVVGGRLNIRVRITFEREGSTFQRQNQQRRREAKQKLPATINPPVVEPTPPLSTEPGLPEPVPGNTPSDLSSPAATQS